MTCIIGKNVSMKQHKKLATHVTEGCLFLTINKWKDNLLVIIYHNIKHNLIVIYVCITCRRAYYSSKRSQIYNIIVPDTARIATRNMKHSMKLINGSEKRLILWNYILIWINPVGSFQAPSNVEVEYLPWTTETMSGFKKQKAIRISTHIYENAHRLHVTSKSQPSLFYSLIFITFRKQLRLRTRDGISTSWKENVSTSWYTQIWESSDKLLLKTSLTKL